MGITVKIFHKDNKSLDFLIFKLATELSEKHTEILAEKTKEELIKTIDETRLRTVKPTGFHIKDAIEVEKLNDGYGVGNFQTLNKTTPWWAWINYGRAFSGREIPTGINENSKIRGHFEPDVKGIFTKGKPSFPMNPKKAIPAHNYIEKALGIIYSLIKNSGLLR